MLNNISIVGYGTFITKGYWKDTPVPMDVDFIGSDGKDDPVICDGSEGVLCDESNVCDFRDVDSKTYVCGLDAGGSYNCREL